MDKFLQLVGWRDSPGSTRLFASRRAAALAVVIIVLAAGSYRLLGLI
jgi:hypothetical protein